MITTAVAASTDGRVILGSGPTYGILLVTLFIHGIMCSAGTRIIARLNLGFSFLISTSNPSSCRYQTHLRFSLQLEGLCQLSSSCPYVQERTGFPLQWHLVLSRTRPDGQIVGCSDHSHKGEVPRLRSIAAGWAFLLAFIAPMWQFTGCECCLLSACRFRLR